MKSLLVKGITVVALGSLIFGAIYTAAKTDNAGLPGIFIAGLGVALVYLMGEIQRSNHKKGEAERRRQALAWEIEMNLRSIRGVIERRVNEPDQDFVLSPLYTFMWQVIITSGDIPDIDLPMLEALEGFYGGCDEINLILQGYLLYVWAGSSIESEHASEGELRRLRDELEPLLLTNGEKAVNALLPEEHPYPNVA